MQIFLRKALVFLEISLSGRRVLIDSDEWTGKVSSFVGNPFFWILVLWKRSEMPVLPPVGANLGELHGRNFRVCCGYFW